MAFLKKLAEIKIDNQLFKDDSLREGSQFSQINDKFADNKKHY